MQHVWGTEEVHTECYWGDLSEGDHLEDLGVEGSVILKWIFMKWNGAWTDLAQDRDRLVAVVNVVMNNLLLQNARNFLSRWGPVSFSRRVLSLVVI